jgi:hypothetical protein
MPLDVNRLRQERLYEARAPLDTLSADLASIENLAAGLRASRKRLQLAGAGMLLAGLIGLAVFFPVGIALFAVAVYLFFRVKAYPKAIANNARRCELGKSVTAMLAHDADARSPAAIRLAFDPQRELLAESQLARRRNGKEKLFKASWFSVETSLHDGTTFTATVDDLVRQRSFTNPRGKSKTKTRTRSLVGMRFAYPSKLYGDLTSLAEMMQKEIQLPPSASVRGLEVTGRVVKVKAVVTQSEELARATSMLALGVYRVMNLSREVEARKRAQQKSGGAP